MPQKAKTKKFFALLIFSILLFSSLAFIKTALAADTSCNQTQAGNLAIQLEMPFGSLGQNFTINGDAIGRYIAAIYIFGSAAVVVFCIIMIMVGGLQWILYGTADKVSKAKETIVKALIGLFIAIFAVFILEVLNPGAVSFNPISPIACTGMPCCSVNGRYQFADASGACPAGGSSAPTDKCVTPTGAPSSPPTATCTDDLNKDCGTSYPDPLNAGSNCIGKKCPIGVPPQVCLNTSGTWACNACRKVDETCTINTDCCQGTCVTGSCKASAPIGEALGRPCGITEPPCPSPLVCEDSWFSSCGYGKLGQDCNNDSQCNQADGYYCSTEGWNVCLKKVQLGRCDSTQNDSKVCPSGYSCKRYNDLVYCDTLGAGERYGNVKCNNSSFSEGDKDSICMKTFASNPTDYCVCDCDNDSECAGVTYPGTGGDAASKCQTAGYNYCASGQYGSPCDSNSECISGICMTFRKKMCSQGDVGEGCTNGSECQKANKCCKNTCVPDSFACPAGATVSDN